MILSSEAVTTCYAADATQNMLFLAALSKTEKL